MIENFCIPVRQLNMYGFKKISAFHHPEEYHTLGSTKCSCSHNLPYMVYQRAGFHRGMNPAQLSGISRRTKVASGQENMEQDSDVNLKKKLFKKKKIIRKIWK